MNWLSSFFTSSLGKKLIMSLTGLFLVTFLVVHLIGNFQLLMNDNGKAFNIYTEFMSSNALIQLVSKGLYLFIILHTIQGLMLWRQNRSAKGQKYVVSSGKNTSWASRNMALLGTLVLAFIFIHMGDFWFKIKFDPESFAMMNYDEIGYPIKDAYAKVLLSFKNPAIVIAYLIGMFALGFHLLHGFQSAFQSLGLNHHKYTPFIELVGKIIGVLIPIGFAIIPIIMFFS